MFEMELCIDARSVFDSLVAAMAKTPSEASLLRHVLWLREFLEKGIVSNLVWVDTRDMIVDGSTQGAALRNLLLAAMDGKYCLEHECAQRSTKRLSESQVIQL